MKQYLDLMKRTLEEGEMLWNNRTQSHTLTTIDATFKYTPDEFPLVTTRKSYWKQAIMEMIAYMRGYTDLRQFHRLGVNTWDANVNAWVSEHKQSETDAGIIYGKSAEVVGFGYTNVVSRLINNPTDRGIIWNFWNPEWFKQGCLRPCMYAHQFNVVNDKLYLTSTQRSVDIPIGLNFNMVQVWFLGAITAQLTGLEFAGATHHLVNCHIYANQVKQAEEQVKREPYPLPKLVFKQYIDIDTIMYLIDKDNFDEYFELVDYQHHPPIKYPFTV